MSPYEAADTAAPTSEREQLAALIVFEPLAFTVNPLVFVAVPSGVVTVKSRVPVAAPLLIVIVTGRLVAVPPLPIVAVTPLPLNVTDVAPVRFVPVIVDETLAP